MNIGELKRFLIVKNMEYRQGIPSISDQEYDLALEEFRHLVSDREYIEFRESLFENKGKIPHPYIMGSLEKLKAEDYDSAGTWVTTKLLSSQESISALLVMAKIDGMSCRLRYHNGVLIEAASRGDGFAGEDILDKVQNIVPKSIPLSDSTDNADINIRGELVITKNDFQALNQIESFKNARNAVVGIINRKDDTQLSKYISFIPYEIMGSSEPRQSQLEILKTWFNVCVDFTIFKFIVDMDFIRNPDKTDTNTQLNKIYNSFCETCQYEIDGLVICKPNYLGENAKLPEYMIAYKCNMMIAESTLLDIDWGLPSKDGKLIPVAIIDPIELGGAVVSRATCYNAEWLRQSNLKYLSNVTVLKSGDIIPKIINIYNDPDAKLYDIEMLTHCPCCESELIWDGVHLKCPNPNCSNRQSHQAAQFIRKLGIKNVSKKTLENLNLITIPEIIKFKPDLTKCLPSTKSFYLDLRKTLLKTPFKKLLMCCNWPGISDKTFEKIWSNVNTLMTYSNSYPRDIPGFTSDVQTELTNKLSSTNLKVAWRTFQRLFAENLNKISAILMDDQYSPVYQNHVTSFSGPTIKIVFTGALNTMSRSSATKLANSAGFTVVNGITKDTKYLVTNDSNSNSTKAKKARDFGITVISEEDFLQLVKTQKDESEYAIGDL